MAWAEVIIATNVVLLAVCIYLIFSIEKEMARLRGALHIQQKTTTALFDLICAKPPERQ